MPLDFTRIKALCFDVDGTLSDTDDQYTQLASLLFPRSIFKDPNHIARRLVMWIEAPGNALLGLADRLGIDDEMTMIIDWMSRHRVHSKSRFLLVPGVDEMLKNLYGRYPMAIISARDKNGTMAFLQQFDLLKYFDPVVTNLSAKHTKPYPDPILLAAKRMNVAPENCLMIGDTTVDIRAGRSANAQTVGVLCGFGEEKELRKMGADMILENTSMLEEILKRQIP